MSQLFRALSPLQLMFVLRDNPALRGAAFAELRSRSYYLQVH